MAIITNVSRHGRKLHFRTDGKIVDELCYSDLQNGLREKQCFKPELPVKIQLSAVVFSEKAKSVILVSDKDKNLHIPTLEWDCEEVDWPYLSVEEFAKNVVILTSDGKVAMWLHRKFAFAANSLDDFVRCHNCQRVPLRFSLKPISRNYPSTFNIYLDGVSQGSGVVHHRTNEAEIVFEIIFVFYIDDNNTKAEIYFVDGQKLAENVYRSFEVGMVTNDQLIVNQSKNSPKIKLIHKVMEEMG